MKNMFNINDDERQRILSLHENSTKKQYLNVLSEQEQFYKGSDGKVGKLVGPQVLPAGATKITQQEYETAIKTQSPEGAATTTTTTLKPADASVTWLKFPGDKNYEYLKKDNKWFTRRVGTTKEFDLSSNPKYKGTVDKLNKQFPDGKSPAGGVKNETLQGAPVYYPWIQDGKVNPEKLKQSVEDNSIYTWGEELKKLTPEQLKKVKEDFVSSGIPSNLTTTKGTGLQLAINDVIKTASEVVGKKIQQGTPETQGSNANQPQGNTEDLSNAPEQKGGVVGGAF